MTVAPQIFTTEPLAVRGLAALMAADAGTATKALRGLTTRALGQIEGSSVRCEVGGGARRSDLTAHTKNGKSLFIEAKIDAAPDPEQIGDAFDSARWDHIALLIPTMAAADVVAVAAAQPDLHIVEWAPLLRYFPGPIARLLAQDVAAISAAPAAKGRQREALHDAQQSVRFGAWSVSLKSGTSGWPSILLQSPSGQVVGQVEGPRTMESKLTFGGAIGFTEDQTNPRLARLLARAKAKLEAAELRGSLHISRREGDRTGRAESLRVPPWLTRGYGGSYVGVRTVKTSDAEVTLARTLRIGRLLEKVASGTP